MFNFFLCSPIYKSMKYIKLINFVIIPPLLLSFSLNIQEPDRLRLADFTLTPINYKVDNSLNFVFLTTQAAKLSASARLLLTNRTFLNRELDRKQFSVMSGKNYLANFYVPANYLSSGSNLFTLEYTFLTYTKTIQFRLGAHSGDALLLPAPALLRDMYLGVTYKDNALTYQHYMFNYSTLFKEQMLIHDLLLDPGLFTSPFAPSSLASADDVKLVFVNKRLLFPRLAKTNDGQPFLSLKLDYIDDNIIFKLAGPIYVDDETHIISPNKEVGFRLTEHIYLPKNKITDLEYGHYELRISGFTNLKFEVIYTFNLSFLKQYLADDGQYQINYGWN